MQPVKHNAVKLFVAPLARYRNRLSTRNNATSLYSCGSPGVPVNATKGDVASSGMARGAFIDAACCVVASSNAEPIGPPGRNGPGSA